MAVRLASPAVMPRAWKRVPGRPRSGGFTIRMIGLEGRLQWRRHKLFKLRARRVQCENVISYRPLCSRVACAKPANRTQNLRFAQFLCAAQEMGRGVIRHCEEPLRRSDPPARAA